MGKQDKAKHIATMYLEDLGNLIKDTIDPYFGFSRYAESLGRSANSFDELYAALNAPVTYIDVILLNILDSAPETAINHILFRCDPEEKDISKGARGPYGLKEYG